MRTYHFRWGNVGRVEGRHYFQKLSQLTIQFLCNLFKDCTLYAYLSFWIELGQLRDF